VQIPDVSTKRIGNQNLAQVYSYSFVIGGYYGSGIARDIINQSKTGK
jgi:hypothetical protein